MSIFFGTPIRGALVKKLFEPTPWKQGKPKKARKAAHNQVWSDHQVLVVRRLRAWYGLSEARIASLLNVSKTQVVNITMFHSRLHIEPGARPADRPSLETMIFGWSELK